MRSWASNKRDQTSLATTKLSIGSYVSNKGTQTVGGEIPLLISTFLQGQKNEGNQEDQEDAR